MSNLYEIETLDEFERQLKSDIRQHLIIVIPDQLPDETMVQEYYDEIIKRIQEEACDVFTRGIV